APGVSIDLGLRKSFMTDLPGAVHPLQPAPRPRQLWCRPAAGAVTRVTGEGATVDWHTVRWPGQRRPGRRCRPTQSGAVPSVDDEQAGAARGAGTMRLGAVRHLIAHPRLEREAA